MLTEEIFLDTVNRGFMPAPTSTAASPLVSKTAAQLGEAVRRARLARNFTGQDFAARARMSVITLKRIERGDVSVGLVFWLSALEAASLLHLITKPADPTADATGVAQRKLRERQRATGMKRQRAAVEEDYDF
jgi:HTH-type transcriptional regulator/antitoxin HipB